MNDTLIFDSFPYFLRPGEPCHQLRLLPQGYPREELIQKMGRADGCDGGLIVFGDGDVLATSCNGAHESSLPETRPFAVGPANLELPFTETAELLNRYRYLRVWHAFHFRRHLQVDDTVQFRNYSGVARSLRELRESNELADFLIEAASTGAELPSGEFLRRASWHDTLASLWSAGLRHDWILWLARHSRKAAAVSPGIVAGVEEILNHQPELNGFRAPRLQQRYPALFNGSDQPAGEFTWIV